ncbi:DUF1326 domain-containing protein [Novacetimonas hansenii]|uniref:DUF1326 domain-containing protein n=1 Tax=Novacetimonas hansenii TaxID=436 RepID=UPI000789B800|nr:DUF1326 domain-containing protein [Novacetimonas hansenii]RFP03139.1 hypothetical protein BGC30_03425 [Novacetimonas hansenii]WEQ57785.1 DUF1326 domain-containing protein [Novacetimonas hansenii]CUW46298.1 hypothetical protein ATCC53582_00390 [Novacetimonas hansenii]
MSQTNWKLEGSYFEACNCETACPCVFLSPPTEGDCTVLVAWHIETGHFGDVKLDGLNVAMAVHSPGNMIDGGWKAAAYLDDKAESPQAAALQLIFSGQAGGHPSVLASFIEEIVGAKSVPMQYYADGKNSRLSIPGITEVSIERMDGQNGQPVTISNHPLCIVPGIPAIASRSTNLTFKDFNFNWQLSGRSGFMSKFVYQAN